jgi:MOSC domain-containing protein YiiM
MSIVLSGGVVRPGDPILAELPARPRLPLVPV